MSAHSRSKNGVASLAYVAGIHAFARIKGVDGRDKLGHDDWAISQAEAAACLPPL